MACLPVLSPPSSRAQKRSRPGDSANGGKKKDKDKESNKKAYIPSYVQAGEKCAVCGDNSTGTHYRAMTCEGCKGFFRRTIQKSKGAEPNLVCKKEEKCEMTPQTRNACQYCRYKKCLAVKMDPASVLSEMERNNLQRLIAANRKERQKKSKRSLSAEEWAELQQIANSYKSPSIKTFFSLSVQNRQATTKSKVVQKVTSPGVWHAFNFVRNIPGIHKIHKDDLAVLIRKRLIDILALLMAEVYNAAENELCFGDIRLRETDMQKEFPKLKRIFKYAKFYSKFHSEDGMILGCLCATRFLNPDGLKRKLREPEKVDQASDYIVNLSLKYWATLNNDTLVRDLCKGLPDFENIRKHKKDILLQITMMNERVEDIKNLIHLNPLPPPLEVPTPEYMNRSTSTAPILRCSSASTTDASEDEVESDSVKLEMSSDEEVGFHQDEYRGRGQVYTQSHSERQLRQQKNFREPISDMTQENLVSSASCGGNGYSWHCSGLPFTTASSSENGENRRSGSKSPAKKIMPEAMMTMMDATLHYQPGMAFRSYEAVQLKSPRPDLRGYEAVQLKSPRPDLRGYEAVQLKSPRPDLRGYEPVQLKSPKTDLRSYEAVQLKSPRPDLRSYEAVQLRSPRPDFQPGIVHNGSVTWQSESPVFIPQRLHNHLSMVDTSRIQIPQNTSFHSQGDAGTSGELILLEKDIEHLKKYTANVMEMLRILCGLIKAQGIHPEWDSIWKTVQTIIGSPNLSAAEPDGVGHKFTSSVPVSPLPHSSHNESILHHPEVSRALSSRQLSYAYDTGNRIQYSSHLSSPIVCSSSSSSLCHSSFHHSPDTSQNVTLSPEIDSEPFRLQSLIDRFKIQLHHQPNSQSRPCGQDPYQADRLSNFISDHIHNVSTIQDPNEPPVSFISQAAHSSHIISPPHKCSTADSTYSNEHSEVNVQCGAPETAIPLLKRKLPSEVLGVKKKWLRAHFNEVG